MSRRSLATLAMAALTSLVMAACGADPDVQVTTPTFSATPLTLDPATLPFPHPFIYGSSTDLGWPFVGTLDEQIPAPGAPLNDVVITAYSRFPLLVLPPTPVNDIRPDILVALRNAAPTNLIMAYTPASTTFCVGTYPAGAFARRYWEAVEQFDGDGEPYSNCEGHGDSFLWMQDGLLASATPHDLEVNVNLAKRIDLGGSVYQYVVAEAIADVMFDELYVSNAWNGIFIDHYCDDILWMESATSKFDYARAGYGTNNAAPASRTAFGDGWKAGHAALASRLRSRIDAAGADFVVSGSCGQGPKALYSTLNGWMRESFPYQNGGSFYDNMFGDPGGYLLEESRFLSPQANFIFTAAEPASEPYNPFNQRKVRFGLAAAALGNGFHAFENATSSATADLYFDWWYDEYGVDMSTARASDATGRGYLGLAKGGVTQVIAANANPDLGPDGGFETTLAGWTLNKTGPATATAERAPDNGGQGAWAAKVTVTAIGAAASSVNLTSDDTFGILAGQEYSITFWARAAALRDIAVVFDRPAAGGYASQVQPIGSTWQRYQVRLVPEVSEPAAYLRFDLGQAVGEVWLDDLHVQKGITSVYRRDFEHGLVLVNPAQSDQDVALERPFKKIRGVSDPQTNDGSVVTQVHLSGAGPGGVVGTALFLLDVDTTAPAAITDLRVGP